MKASKWGQKIFLYSAVKARIFNFRRLSWQSFAPPQNHINKPASNNRGIFIEAVFLFVATVEEHELIVNNLKCQKIFSVVRRKSLHELSQTSRNAALMNLFATRFSKKN